MEKHPRRESILLGWSPQISFGNSASSSPRVSVGNSDIDYNDVFGGPPRRRSSINDSCYSLNETADSFPTKQDAEPVASRNLWSGLSEKPVFGEEPAARRHPGGFFDDIFKGEESGASTPKRHDREPFSPMSSSLGLSPFRSFPPMAETFESPSLAAKFSLPARVALGIDVSALDSATDSTNKYRDAGFSGENHSYSPSLPTSSTLSNQVPEDAKHDIHSFYWSSISSQESCQNREEPSLQEKTDGTNIGSNLEKVFKSTEDSTSQSQFPFHFSIYKWANKEVSFAMPPTRGHVSRLKQTAKTRRCSSSNGRMVTEMNDTQSPTSTLGDSDRLSSDHSLKSKDSFKLRPEKEESDSILEETNQQSKKRPPIVKEPILPKPQPEKMSSLHKTADRALLHHSRREAKYTGGYGLEEQNQYEQKPSQLVEEPILSKSESEKASCVQETVDCAPTSTLSDSDRLSSDHSLRSKDSVKLRPEKEESDSILEETNQRSKKRPPIVKEPILPKPQPEKMSSLHKTADGALLHHSRREAKYAGGYGLEEQNQYEQKSSQIVEEPSLSKSESEKASCVQKTVDCAPLKHSKREEKVNSFIDIGVPEKTEKVLPEFTKEAVKHESRSACSIVDDNKAKGAKETLTFDDGNEIKVKSNRRSPLSFDSNKILKKEDGEATIVRKTEVEKSSSQSSSSNSRLSADGRRVGKVKEFVKIFNQELSSMSKADMDNHNPSSKQKHGGNSEANIEVCATKTDLKVPLQNLDNTVAPVSVKVDELSKQSSNEQPASKTDSHGNNTAYSEQNSPAESVPEDSTFTVVDIDETFQENFLIKELPPDEIKQPQTQNDREERKAIDDKIRQWSSGKEGNIRSLLSTLQYVLWPESGWKPVPLVDIINGNAVKRSYQRALLCLHPDKLQQRGVTSQQKYTAEKVFDILQEAWTLFSSLGLS